MMDIIAGIVCLIAIVLLKLALSHRAQRRVMIAWEQTQASLAQGNHELAMTHVADCVRLAPLWLPARFLFGSLLARHGRLDEAEEQFKMAQALQPRDATGFLELGIFYLTATERLDEGLAQLRAALAHDSSARHTIETDPRLERFRNTPAFENLERA